MPLGLHAFLVVLTPKAAVWGGHGYTNDGGICNGPSALGGRRRVLLLW